MRSAVVIGVDVGGKNKGFHAVALRAGRFVDKAAGCDAKEIAEWCRTLDASVIGIDAPCRWSRTGKRRPCERELAGIGISAFSTPSLAVGQVHPFYDWMLNGVELFRLLAPYYPLYNGRSSPLNPTSFETFPHAVACALAGKKLSAKEKRLDRRRLLALAGIDTDSFTNIDEVDAALCAVTAQRFLAGTFKAYGDDVDGFIVVPSAS
jgi:predicted nuclease with RNAse H fold